MQIRALPPASGAGALLALTMLGCGSELPTDPDLARGGASAPFRVSPTALTFRVPGEAPATVTASVQYVGLITATSSNTACATVSPASAPTSKPKGSSVYVATFSVRAVGRGTCSITFKDKQNQTATTSVQVLLPSLPGSRLVYWEADFEAGNTVHLMSPVGAAPLDLTPSGLSAANPVLSPDGSQIAFAATASGRSDIYRMNVDGSGATPILEGTGLFSPTWSPDGLRLAYSTRFCCGGDIGVIDTDGSDNLLITSEARHGQPAWSPDGTRILFTSGIREDLGFALFAIAPDGTGSTLFLGGAKQPAWSPDGSRVAFVKAAAGDPDNDEIYVINADGTGEVRLTNSPGIDGFPAWSPDGTMIAFDSERSGNRDIFVMKADGTGVVNLTDAPGIQTQASWR